MAEAYGVCMLCEASCGIRVEYEGDEVRRIHGDAFDPLSRGHVCPKVMGLKDLHEDLDRLRAPLRRVGERWEAIPWDEALDEAAERLAEIQAEHGRHAVGVYVGNPTVHSHGATLFTLLLWKTLRTRNVASANSVDAWPRLLVSHWLYGSQAVLPVPDLERTRYLLMLGANPVVSNGSIMTAPGFVERTRELRARGGRLVVVDPRKTETAELADEHVFLRPGSDAAFLLSLLQHVFERGLDAPSPHLPLEGLDRLRELARDFPAERTHAFTGVAPETLRRLAEELAREPRGLVYGRVGTSLQAFGALATWLTDAVNLVLGRMDRPGGAMFSTPAVDLPSLAARTGQVGSYGRYRSRVSGVPEVGGEIPATVLAEEIETDGPGRIRALVTHAGNPVLSVPNGARLERALGHLDFMVSIDVYLNETTRHAHLVLPPTFGLERPHYSLATYAFAVRNVARYAPAILPAPGRRHDWQILLGLSRRLMAYRSLSGRAASAALARLERTDLPRALLDLLLRAGPHGPRPGRRGVTLARLLDEPHGVDLGPLQPRLLELLRGRPVKLAPEPLLADVARLRARLDATPEAGLTLLGRRQLRSNNSWMHNSPRLIKGKERCVLEIHPDDAAACGLGDGQRAVVRSAIGALEVPVEVTTRVMRGVVTLPHGFGHHRAGTQLTVAARHAGASLNDVTDDRRRDAVSGVADPAVTVEVAPADA